MTNRIAVVLGLVLVIIVAADLIFLDRAVTVFLGRRFVELIEYVAFWR